MPCKVCPAYLASSMTSPPSHQEPPSGNSNSINAARLNIEILIIMLHVYCEVLQLKATAHAQWAYSFAGKVMAAGQQGCTSRNTSL